MEYDLEKVESFLKNIPTRIEDLDQKIKSVTPYVEALGKFVPWFMNAATTGGAPAAEITKIVEQVQSVLKKFDSATKEPKANLEVVNAMNDRSILSYGWEYQIKDITSKVDNACKDSDNPDEMNRKMDALDKELKKLTTWFEMFNAQFGTSTLAIAVDTIKKTTATMELGANGAKKLASFIRERGAKDQVKKFDEFVRGQIRTANAYYNTEGRGSDPQRAADYVSKAEDRIKQAEESGELNGVEKSAELLTELKGIVEDWRKKYAQNMLSQEVKVAKEKAESMFRTCSAYENSDRDRSFDYLRQAKELIAKMETQYYQVDGLNQWAEDLRKRIDDKETELLNKMIEEKAKRSVQDASTRLSSCRAYFSDGRSSENNRQQAIGYLEQARKLAIDLSNGEFANMPVVTNFLPGFLEDCAKIQQQIADVYELEKAKKAMDGAKYKLSRATSELGSRNYERALEACQEAIDLLENGPLVEPDIAHRKDIQDFIVSHRAECMAAKEKIVGEGLKDELKRATSSIETMITSSNAYINNDPTRAAEYVANAQKAVAALAVDPRFMGIENLVGAFFNKATGDIQEVNDKIRNKMNENAVRDARNKVSSYLSTANSKISYMNSSAAEAITAAQEKIDEYKNDDFLMSMPGSSEFISGKEGELDDYRNKYSQEVLSKEFRDVCSRCQSAMSIASSYLSGKRFEEVPDRIAQCKEAKRALLDNANLTMHPETLPFAKKYGDEIQEMEETFMKETYQLTLRKSRDRVESDMRLAKTYCDSQNSQATEYLNRAESALSAHEAQYAKEEAGYIADKRAEIDRAKAEYCEKLFVEEIKTNIGKADTLLGYANTYLGRFDKVQAAEYVNKAKEAAAILAGDNFFNAKLTQAFFSTWNSRVAEVEAKIIGQARDEEDKKIKDSIEGQLRFAKSSFAMRGDDQVVEYLTKAREAIKAAVNNESSDFAKRYEKYLAERTAELEALEKEIVTKCFTEQVKKIVNGGESSLSLAHTYTARFATEEAINALQNVEKAITQLKEGSYASHPTAVSSVATLEAGLKEAREKITSTLLAESTKKFVNELKGYIRTARTMLEREQFDKCAEALHQARSKAGVGASASQEGGEHDSMIRSTNDVKQAISEITSLEVEFAEKALQTESRTIISAVTSSLKEAEKRKDCGLKDSAVEYYVKACKGCERFFLEPAFQKLANVAEMKKKLDALSKELKQPLPEKVCAGEEASSSLGAVLKARKGKPAYFDFRGLVTLEKLDGLIPVIPTFSGLDLRLISPFQKLNEITQRIYSKISEELRVYQRVDFDDFETFRLSAPSWGNLQEYMFKDWKKQYDSLQAEVTKIAPDLPQFKQVTEGWEKFQTAYYKVVQDIEHVYSCYDAWRPIRIEHKNLSTYYQNLSKADPQKNPDVNIVAEAGSFARDAVPHVFLFI